jgi:hypothetical protein
LIAATADAARGAGVAAEAGGWLLTVLVHCKQEQLWQHLPAFLQGHLLVLQHDLGPQGQQEVVVLLGEGPVGAGLVPGEATAGA